MSIRNLETPSISSSALATNVYHVAGTGLNPFGGVTVGNDPLNYQKQMEDFQRQEHQRRLVVRPQPAVVQSKEPIMTTHRLVQVFIADTNENLPLDKMLVYRGEPTFTDLTDQELFHEIDIKSLLDTHNLMRIKYRDKAVKERVENLEPVRIRDLKMSVVVVATF